MFLCLGRNRLPAVSRQALQMRQQPFFQRHCLARPNTEGLHGGVQDNPILMVGEVSFHDLERARALRWTHVVRQSEKQLRQSPLR